MDNLRFVLEAPQLNQTHKKRPRLVTSCDNCRLKKIKCVQIKAHDRCEACEAGNTSCQFRDRERYFAERSRIVSGATPAASSSTTSSRRSSSQSSGQAEGSTMQPPSNIRDESADARAWYSGGLHSPTSETGHSSRYSSNSPASYSHISSSPHSVADMWLSPDQADFHRSGTQYATAPMSSLSATGQYASNTTLTQDTSMYRDRTLGQRDLQLPGLFDPRQPNRPHPTLLSHLVPVFFEYFGRLFPFLQYDEVSKRMYNDTLPLVLANAIAGVACRYSQSPEIVGRGTSVVANAYCDMAKHLLSESSHVPYIEILHTVIIIAWSEYKHGRASGFLQYSEMATKMAVNLGLGNDNTAHASSERERSLYRTTWTSVVQLQQVSLTILA
ncbi:hypothetical protein BV25DRAFT_1843188 [Artomyces pyxidatus]|uniref:Uncharacterized protein n=1 Tax=Artomyces pyxidatus TaxID=48021 RepID=A0ACB8SFQ8_9AGAM|nr:hypothetical protein BV25DRAFT_1843188 [Artomyces pyxidatus]